MYFLNQRIYPEYVLDQYLYIYSYFLFVRSVSGHLMSKSRVIIQIEILKTLLLTIIGHIFIALFS
jgi:hypothetical protein